MDRMHVKKLKLSTIFGPNPYRTGTLGLAEHAIVGYKSKEGTFDEL